MIVYSSSCQDLIYPWPPSLIFAFLLLATGLWNHGISISSCFKALFWCPNVVKTTKSPYRSLILNNGDLPHSSNLTLLFASSGANSVSFPSISKLALQNFGSSSRLLRIFHVNLHANFGD